MKNKKLVWRLFLAFSFFFFVALLSIVLFFIDREQFEPPFDINVADQFVCPDGRNSFPHPSDVFTCSLQGEEGLENCDARQFCVNASHPQGIGGSHPFCNPGQIQIVDGLEYVCVGYPYESDGCVYLAGCRGLRATGSSTGSVTPQLCGPDGSSNCTLVNDGTCGTSSPNNQRILCVSNVDNSTVCYERNEQCTNPIENPVTTDPIDPDPVDNTQAGAGSDSNDTNNSNSGSDGSENTASEGIQDNIVGAVGGSQILTPSGVLPNTATSTSFSITLLLGLCFIMTGLILNRFGNKEYFLIAIDKIEQGFPVKFPSFLKNFLEKRHKNMVDYERKRFESILENER